MPLSLTDKLTFASLLLASTALSTVMMALDGRPASAQTTSGTVTYTYDALGRVISVTYDTGVTITYTYDATGNATQEVITVGSPPPPPPSPPP